MDLESLYTASKWDLLKLLEHESLSPIELAKKTKGSVANISQQLRLLEMAGLVTSTRVPNRARGQPRVLYSLAQNSCYVISTANSFVEKKQLPVSESHQIVLKIWFLEQEELRRYTEKAFWKVEEHLPNIQALYVDSSSTSPINLYVVANDALNIPAIQQLRHGSQTRQLVTRVLTHDDLEPIRESLVELHKK